MDQQAQDRCHRIGQTREVHIYRLVSEVRRLHYTGMRKLGMRERDREREREREREGASRSYLYAVSSSLFQNTIEENILRKSDQKRQLDWLAIQSGGFNTDILTRININDFFSAGGGGGGVGGRGGGGGGGGGGLSADEVQVGMVISCGCPSPPEPGQPATPAACMWYCTPALVLLCISCDFWLVVAFDTHSHKVKPVVAGLSAYLARVRSGLTHLNCLFLM